MTIFEPTIMRPYVDNDPCVNEIAMIYVPGMTTDLHCVDTGVVVYSTPSANGGIERAERWAYRAGFKRVGPIGSDWHAKRQPIVDRG